MSGRTTDSMTAGPASMSGRTTDSMTAGPASMSGRTTDRMTAGPATMSGRTTDRMTAGPASMSGRTTDTTDSMTAGPASMSGTSMFQNFLFNYNMTFITFTKVGSLLISHRLCVVVLSRWWPWWYTGGQPDMGCSIVITLFRKLTMLFWHLETLFSTECQYRQYLSESWNWCSDALHFLVILLVVMTLSHSRTYVLICQIRNYFGIELQLIQLDGENHLFENFAPESRFKCRSEICWFWRKVPALVWNI